MGRRPPPEATGEALELLRSRSGLSIDLEGRLCHQGTPITHARTLEVIWGSLTRMADGRYAVRVGREVGYLQLADAPYAVRGVTFEREAVEAGHAAKRASARHRAEAAGARLVLSDGSAERLDPATLSLDREGVLQCRVKAGEHRARFARAAQVALGLALEEGPDGRLTLRLGGRSWPVEEE